MTTIVREITPEQVERGMIVKHVKHHPSYTVETRGPVRSVGNRTTLLIGDDADYADVPCRGTAEVNIQLFEVVELPEGPLSLILINYDGEQPLMLTSEGRWLDSKGELVPIELVMKSFVRILWEPES